MKIIHCADVHLGSKMESILQRDKAEERRSELRATFVNLLDRAKALRAEAVLLCGDIFDSDRPFKKDKEFFYSVVRKNPDIEFFYLRGNHDGQESFTEELPNLKTFSRDWTTYDIGDIAVTGVELAGDNAQSIYASLRLNPSKKNLVLLHGFAGDASGKDKINLLKLREKNIDYLALGHIHTHGGFEKLDERGVWAYSGCLEGRGFDEEGEKGFILLDVGDKITSEFIPFSKRAIRILKVNVSGATDSLSAYDVVKSKISAIQKNDIVRVELEGDISFDNADLARETQKRLDNEGFYFSSVKDTTQQKIDIEKVAHDITLAAEFIRTVMQSEKIGDDEKNRIISVGLKALNGREIDL